MRESVQQPLLDESIDPLVRYHACKAMARGYAEDKKTDKARLSHARAYCTALVFSYWNAVSNKHNSALKCKEMPLENSLPIIALDAQKVATETGRLIANFPVQDAGYLIGSIYTVMLPAAMRSDMGAYYTPPPLVERLLDLAEDAGFDYIHGTAIDPACGGGAFLAPVALRMWQRTKDASPSWILRRLSRRLKGIEIDPFAAWMTLVLLEAAIFPLLIAAKGRLPTNLITIGNALEPREIGQYDLVIGNPPYGRVSLSEPLRNLYARSLYGHANLYGLFTDLAIRLTKPKGVIAYLTPTSFLGGKYFKALRDLLTKETTPLAFDFVSDRDGVFDDVLQETLLTSYKKELIELEATVSLVIPHGLNNAQAEIIGKTRILPSGNPWMLPRSSEDAHFLNQMACMPTRLSNLGYVVTTGQLVWNRHKPQLQTKKTKSSLPLIWAEAVTTNGFKFSSNRRGHVPYIEVKADQPHLITKKSCVLVQRTTSKEQSRRILAAALPQQFLDLNNGAVVENHLNMVIAPSDKLARISIQTIESLLNTETIDRAFRCISGSVAVSAYELNALPLPNLQQLLELELLVINGSGKALIERKVKEYYEVNL